MSSGVITKNNMMNISTMKIEYIIKCEVKEFYYDDNHQCHSMIFTKYVTDKSYELINRNKNIYLTENPLQAKKFYALELAENFIKNILLKNAFCYKNLINVKAEKFEVTTPEKEGIVEKKENFYGREL